jgi:hypothetical protein
MCHAIKRYKGLKKLALQWNSTARLSWDDTAPEDCIFLLDSVEAPYGCSPGRGPDMLSSLKFNAELGAWWSYPTSDSEFLQLENGIRNALGMDANAVLDHEDDTLILRGWQARHQDRVAGHVRALAEACPSLDEFEWHMLDQGDHQGYPLAARWAWYIERDYAGQVTQLLGDLTWTDGPRGDPMPLHPLVGEELQRALTLQKISLRKYYHL